MQNFVVHLCNVLNLNMWPVGTVPIQTPTLSCVSGSTLRQPQSLGHNCPLPSWIGGRTIPWAPDSHLIPTSRCQGAISLTSERMLWILSSLLPKHLKMMCAAELPMWFSDICDTTHLVGHTCRHSLNCWYAARGVQFDTGRSRWADHVVFWHPQRSGTLGSRRFFPILRSLCTRDARKPYIQPNGMHSS